MPSMRALQTGEYCPQCGNDFPASKLAILFMKLAPTKLIPHPEWKRVGRYCDSCIPKEEEIERANGAVEFNTETFVPGIIEGGNAQMKK